MFKANKDKKIIIMHSVLFFSILIILSIGYLKYPYQLVPRDIFIIKDVSFHLNRFIFRKDPFYTIWDLWISSLLFFIPPTLLNKILTLAIYIVSFYSMYFLIKKIYNKYLFFPALFYAINPWTLWFAHGGDGWINLAFLYAFIPLYFYLFNKESLKIKDYLLAAVPILFSSIPWFFYLIVIFFTLYLLIFEKNKLTKDKFLFIIYLITISTIFYAATSSYFVERIIKRSFILDTYSIYLDFKWAYSFPIWNIFLLFTDKTNAFLFFKLSNNLPYLIFSTILFIIIFLKAIKGNRYALFVLVLLSFILFLRFLTITDLIYILAPYFAVFRAQTKVYYFIIFFSSLILADMRKELQYFMLSLYLLFLSPFVYYLGYSLTELLIFSYNPSEYPYNFTKLRVLYLPFTIEMSNIIKDVYPNSIGFYPGGVLFNVSMKDLRKVLELYDHIFFCSPKIPELIKKFKINLIIIDMRFEPTFEDVVVASGSPYFYQNPYKILTCLSQFYKFKKEKKWFYIAKSGESILM